MLPTDARLIRFFCSGGHTVKSGRVLGMALMFLVACADNKSSENVRLGTATKPSSAVTEEQNQSQAQAETPDASTDPYAESATQEEPREKVDGSKLNVFGTRVSQQRQKLTLGLNLSYDPDGKADYIEYHICPLEPTGKNCPEGVNCTLGGECFEGVTLLNRVRVPLIYGGKVLYKVRACVDGDNALTDVTCGAWDEYTYSSRVYDLEIAKLLNEGDIIKKELGKIVSIEYRGALKRFTEEAKKCDAVNAEVKRILDSKTRVVEQFLRAPVSWFQKAREDVGDTVLGEGGTADVLASVSKLGSEVSKQLEKACVALGKSTHDFVCTFLKGVAAFGKQFLSAMSPVTAIGTISNAIHDVYYGSFLGQGDTLVPKGCYAEQNLQRDVQAIEMKMNTRVQKLQVIKQSLDQKGESLVR